MFFLCSYFPSGRRTRGNIPNLRKQSTIVNHENDQDFISDSKPLTLDIIISKSNFYIKLDSNWKSNIWLSSLYICFYNVLVFKDLKIFLLEN